MVMGDRDAAAFVLHAVARAARPDGSFWFGYNTADNWPSEADHEGALVRAGAIGWAGYAFSFYLGQYPTCAVDDRGCVRERALFRDAAVRAADYLLTLQVRDPGDRRDGLLRLGHGRLALSHSQTSQSIVEIYDDSPEPGISTENNISAWFFLRDLASVTGDEKYAQAAGRIERGLLNGAWNDRLGQFNQGFSAEGAPDSLLALDCASWGALFLSSIGQQEKADRALEAARSLYASRDAAHVGFRPYLDVPVYPTEDVARFYFPGDGRRRWKDLPLVWSEGTARRRARNAAPRGASGGRTGH